jgi:glycosyltransferase 2 family protein
MIGSIFQVRHHPLGDRSGEESIHRHTWKWMAAVALATAAGIWWIYHELMARGFDWGLLAASFARLDRYWLVLSLIPLFGTYYGRALRWAVFLKPLNPHPSMRNLLSATIVGFTAITLFGRPGEFVRPYLIAVKERVPISSQLAAWFLERMFDLLMALLLFGFALVRVTASGVAVGRELGWVLAFGGKIVAVMSVALLFVLLSFRHFAEPARKRITNALRFLPEPHFLRVEKFVTAFVQGVESTRSDGALLLIFLYSVLEWALIAWSYWWLVKAFSGLSLTLVDVIILMGFISFGAAIQIPGIGGGMQVVSILVLTELFEVRLELATAFAFMVWIVTFVAIVPVGMALALRDGLNWHKLREIGREVSQ